MIFSGISNFTVIFHCYSYENYEDSVRKYTDDYIGIFYFYVIDENWNNIRSSSMSFHSQLVQLFVSQFDD
jgi:hypothetical protein